MQKTRKIFKIMLALALSAGIAAGLFFVLILEPRIKFGPALDPARLVNIERTVTILDDTDTPIANPIYDNNKIYTPLSDIPVHTRNAFIAIEDKRFYRHKGIDYRRVMGAAFKNVRSGAFKEGASTISQQLIKNTHLNNDKTISRKITEMRIAKDLERHYTKDEIIEMYLNILYFGNSMYGIGSASRILYGKTPAELSIKESAVLAGIINNPSKYSPYRHPEAALERGKLVLKQMHDNDMLSAEEYEAALNEAFAFRSETLAQDQFINAVVREAADKLGCDKEDIFKRQYTIGTYAAPKLSQQIKAVCEPIKVSDYKLVIADNRTGHVLYTYGNSRNDLSNLKRQPGSALKPILCYAPALENNAIYTVTPILDEKISFGAYSPSNYKDKYYGWVSIKDALKLSLNIPAIKLLEMNGIESSKKMASAAGVRFDKEDNSLALAVGGMTRGATLEQIANSYQAFANGGAYCPISYVKFIADRTGKIIYKSDSISSQIMKDSTAWLITDMLKECAKTGTAKKLAAFSNIAAKTGTVGTKNGNSDAYCIAYSPCYTVAVWFGGDLDNSVSGGNHPTRLARDILQLLADATQFEVPRSVVQLDIDLKELTENHKVMLAGSDIPKRFKASAPFSSDNIPRQYSTVQIPFWEYDPFWNYFFDNFEIKE